MRRILLIFLVGIIPLFAIYPQKKNLQPEISKFDSLHWIDPSSIQIKGYLGEKINLVIEKEIKARNFEDLVEPFKKREETHFWQTEFWGKWILSAIAAYEYTHDQALWMSIKEAIKGLMATQTADGYIGNYATSAQLNHWDIWGRKYTLLGLLAYYDLTGDKNVLLAAQRLANHLLTQVGPGKKNIVETGNYRGMPSSSILEPIVQLYRCTGDRFYLDFAKYIVTQWETERGPNLIRKALGEENVADRFPHPDSWWSWDNGQKAYEMMSCYDGLLELYKITGDPSYLKSVEVSVQNIMKTEINMAGSGTAFECFYHGKDRQTQPTYHTMETCVTFTWIKLCYDLLRLTGNPLYADQIEISTFNALLASVKFDGSQIAKYSPLIGVRHEGEDQCGMHINCCNANGPRGFTLLPRVIYQTSASTMFVNFYGNSSAQWALTPKNKIQVEQVSDYPVSDFTDIRINPEKEALFTVALRIPSWSPQNQITINDIPVEKAHSGQYLKITRRWKKGDKIHLSMDLRGRLVNLNNHQAIVRGPILLARDARFKDGYVDETAVVQAKQNEVNLIQDSIKRDHIWMSFTAPLILGTDLEGEFRSPRLVHFCDFASAGNTWEQDSRYRVWIPQTLNVMKADYKGY